MMYHNSIYKKLAKKLSPKFRIIELFLIASLALTLLLKYLNYSVLDPVLIISMGLLSSLYFLMAFDVDKRIQENALATVVNKANGWGLSILIIGLLFTVKQFPNADMMLNIGTATTLLTIPPLFYIKSKQTDLGDYYRPIFIRSLLYGSIGLIVILYNSQTVSFS